ncbi:MAG: hypothetical protein ACFFAN_15855 [Promethearchaeota archaeon]
MPKKIYFIHRSIKCAATISHVWYQSHYIFSLFEIESDYLFSKGMFFFIKIFA